MQYDLFPISWEKQKLATMCRCIKNERDKAHIFVLRDELSLIILEMRRMFPFVYSFVSVNSSPL